MRAMSSSALRGLLRPFLDVLEGLDRCLDRGARGLFLMGLGLALGWWVYVPLHELLHAAACAASGGTVSRLEIDPLYGGALLARVFPFVTAGGEYAGRLSGFDTGGDDRIYLATDLGPFVLTLFPGVWWMRRAARRRQSLRFGMALPFALAPFLSLPGDAYEIGSILATRLPPWDQAPLRELLRGDDLGKKLGEIAALGHPPWGGLAVAVSLAVLWAALTCRAGGAVARRLDEPPLAPRARPAAGPAQDAYCESFSHSESEASKAIASPPSEPT